jgi:hypothetical protein
MLLNVPILTVFSMIYWNITCINQQIVVVFLFDKFLININVLLTHT